MRSAREWAGTSIGVRCLSREELVEAVRAEMRQELAKELFLLAETANNAYREHLDREEASDADLKTGEAFALFSASKLIQNFGKAKP